MNLTIIRSLVLAFLSIALPFASLRAADHQVINLWPEGVPGLRPDASAEKLQNTTVSNVHRPTLTVFRPAADKAYGTAVIICPGGRYMRLSIENEGNLIAQRFNSLGVTAFVLRYRLIEYGHPAPMRDVLRAVRLLRSQAADFGVRADRIGVLGASAGGHLAACAGTLFNAPEGKTGAALDAISARPDFLILLYPVITMREPFTHLGSRDGLLGTHPAPELIELLSLELHVTKDTPPVFMIHTEEDKTVPLENSLMFYQALHAAGVPAELHLWPKGTHGVGMRQDAGAASTWTNRCEEWMRVNGWLPAPPRSP